MPKIGAHVSAAVSLDRSFDKAVAIGAECTQIFISPPQRWLMTKHDHPEIETYLEKKKATGIEPTFIHGPYLINLASDNPDQVEKSIEWLIYALQMAQKLEARGVIFHTGSHKGRGYEESFEQVKIALERVLEQSPTGADAPYLILENCAGSGGAIGRTFHELGQYIKELQDPRLKVCFDTQHGFASGYDIREALTIKDVLEEFDQEIGLSNLAAIHANDSKTDYKSNKDRHENIGEGLIGKDAFEILLNHPALNQVPFLLEVPGIADTGPDKENIDLMKSLRNN